jgi:hypothetical protein
MALGTCIHCRRVKSFGRQWIRVPKGHTTSWALTYNTCCPLFLPLEREERDEDSMGVVGCRTRLSRSNWSGPEAPGCSLTSSTSGFRPDTFPLLFFSHCPEDRRRKGRKGRYSSQVRGFSGQSGPEALAENLWTCVSLYHFLPGAQITDGGRSKGFGGRQSVICERRKEEDVPGPWMKGLNSQR